MAGAFRCLTLLQAEQSVPPLRRNNQAITRTVAPCKETLTGSNVHQRAENLLPKGVSLGASNLKAHDEGIMEIWCEVKKTNKQLLEYGESRSKGQILFSCVHNCYFLQHNHVML